MSDQNDNKDNAISKKVDKFIMGALIGGAIGSVLGMTFAPKKGKETREVLKEKGKQLFEKGKDVARKLNKKNVGEGGKKMFSIVRDKIREIREKGRIAEIIEENEARKIPHEE